MTKYKQGDYIKIEERGIFYIQDIVYQDLPGFSSDLFYKLVRLTFDGYEDDEHFIEVITIDKYPDICINIEMTRDRKINDILNG